jgi:hypothetical protein
MSTRGFVLLLALSVALASVAACDPPQTEIVPWSTRDILVDHSFQANVTAPRLCVSGPNVYAVWHDDRRSGGRHQVFFNVGYGGGSSWGESDVQLSSDPDGDSIAEYPDIACAGDSVYVVWEDDRDSEFGHKSIYFSHSDDNGMTWNVDQLVTQDPDGDWDAQGPRIAVDYDPEVGPDKTIYITWYDNRDGAYDIYFTRSTNGYNFLVDEVRLDTDVAGGAYSAHPQLVIDTAGGVYVAWEDSRDGGNDVYFNRSLDSGDAWLAEDIRLDGGDPGGESDAFAVALTVDRDAQQPAVHVAWHDDRNGGKDIFYNRSADSGATWQTEATRMDTDVEGGNDSFYPSVYASNGRVMVAWHDDRDVGFDILMRRSQDGGAIFDDEIRMDTDVTGSAHSLGPKLVGVGPNVAGVWTDYRQPVDVAVGHPDIYYRVTNDGGLSWSESDGRVDDDPQATAISDEPQVAMAGPSVYVLWVDYRSGNADLWFRRVTSSAVNIAD